MMARGADQPRVTVAVLNFNGRELLEVILPSLAAQTYGQLEVVVVDNGSSDDSRAYLDEHWPSVAVVSIPRTRRGRGAECLKAQAGASSSCC